MSYNRARADRIAAIVTAACVVGILGFIAFIAVEISVPAAGCFAFFIGSIFGLVACFERANR